MDDRDEPLVTTDAWDRLPGRRYIDGPAGTIIPTWAVMAVVRVVDGDTIHFLVDLGFRVRYEADVRLARCNAPEMPTDAGKTAKAWTSGWLAERDPTDLTVGVHGADRYGRWVGEVIDASRVNLTDALIAAKQAVPWP